MRQMSGGAKWRCGWADRRQVDGALRRPGQRVQHLVAAGDEHEAAVRRRDVLQLPGVVELLGVARPGPLGDEVSDTPLV
jgi:hypothetical protein